MKAWAEHRSWVRIGLWSVFVNGRWMSDWTCEADAVAEAARLRRVWEAEKEALRASWGVLQAQIRSGSDIRTQ